MRAINADAFEKHLEEAWMLHKISNDDLSQIRKWLAEEKTVDAPSGRWICYPESLKYKSSIECSVCGEAFNIINNETKRFNYCPHCGAKMDGEQWMK